MIRVRDKKSYYLYPKYFDARVPRRRGRRVSESRASKSPTLLRDMAICLGELGVHYEVEHEKRHPGFTDQPGRLRIAKTELIGPNFGFELPKEGTNPKDAPHASKNDLIKLIGQRILAVPPLQSLDAKKSDKSAAGMRHAGTSGKHTLQKKNIDPEAPVEEDQGDKKKWAERREERRGARRKTGHKKHK